MKNVTSIFFLFLAFSNNPPSAEGARILAVLLSSAPSHHYGMFQPLLRALVEAGHELVAYTPRPLKNSPANYTNVFLEEFLENEESELLDVMKRHYMKIWDNFGLRSLEWFDKFMANERVRQLLTAKESFDLVIVEPFLMQEFTVVLGHVFRAPVIALSTMVTFDFLNSVVGNPLELATIPDTSAPRTNRMSFMDRLHNCYEILRRLFFYHNHQLPRMEARMRGHFPGAPPLLEMLQGMALVFVNEHPTASYPRPHTPNVVPVGGIHVGASPPARVPEDIQAFIDGAQDGFILFSLGSLMPENGNPEEFYDAFRDVFGQLRLRVLWKVKRPILGLSDNVKTVSWVPQQEILAHKNCKLFITHGGIHSLYEAVYFGVPMISIPYICDQNGNAMFGEAKGVGLMVDRHTVTRESLSLSINTLLSDPSYAANASKLSKVFRDRPLTPVQSVVYWVNYVLRHGGRGLRPPPLPFYQEYLLDIIAATFVALLAVVIFATKLYAWLIHKVLKRDVEVPSHKKYQ